MRNWPFAKGHGTHNDFVIINDRHGMYDPDSADVRFLCDRHGGIGGDGVLRVVRARYVKDWDGDPDLWFMDYRNADGSIAEMCGNGVRVFARYLVEEGLAMGESLPIATRAGLRTARFVHQDQVAVEMGPVVVRDAGVKVELAGERWPALSVDVGNPHAVVEVSDLSTLDFYFAPTWFPSEAFPEGVNVEFVRSVRPGHIAMRVFERGVGETQSCGTGTVAAAAAAAQRDGTGITHWRVDVPGGTVRVDLRPDGSTLTGPAVIVARGEVFLPNQFD
ncbi:diaminopimelate epimerase [Naumannella halotolerans]|uniref:diaminopimelate epimerase n=1 Tax=Naumannella halotolerans TaxID=993414 RepID=UPI00370D7258